MNHRTARLARRFAALTLAAGLCTAFAARSAETAPPETPSAYVEPHIAHEAYGEVRLVVPLTTDDKGVQKMKLRNIGNGLKAVEKWGGSFQVKVVLYARGLSLLKDPDEAMRKQLDLLRAKGVQIVVCGNSLAEQDIDFHSLYKVVDADIVPSGFAEVAFLQARHQYAVDPAN